MKRNRTSSDLSADADALAEWIKEPISVGSIYIKPTEEEQSCCNKCFSIIWYYFCCIYLTNT